MEWGFHKKRRRKEMEWDNKPTMSQLFTSSFICQSHRLAGRCQGQQVVDGSPTALLADVARDGGHHRRAELGVGDRLLHDVGHRDDGLARRRSSRRAAARWIASRRQHGHGPYEQRRVVRPSGRGSAQGRIQEGG